MRKAAIGLAIIVAVILGVVLAAPYLIDGGRFQRDLVAGLSRALGHEVTIDGRVRVRLFPQPMLIARELRLAGPAGQPDLLQARLVEVKPVLWPLLLGQVEIREVWFIDAVAELAPGLLSLPPFGVAAEPADWSIERLSIQNGSVTYRSPGVVERLEHIDADVDLSGPVGPFSVKGALVAHGADLTFEAGAGALDQASVPLHLTLRTRPAARLDIDADMTGQPGDRHIAGHLKLGGDDLAAIVSTLGQVGLPTGLAQSFTLAADLVADSRAVRINQLALDMPELHGTGAMSLAVTGPPRVDLQLNLNHGDIDRWLAGGRVAVAEPAPVPVVVGMVVPLPPVGAKPAVPPSGVVAALLQQDVPVHLDLTIGDLVWRGGIFRQARAELGLDHGQLALTRLATALPGGGDAMASGALTLVDGKPHLAGRFAVQADNLRELAAWLGLRSDGVPPDRLRKAALSGRFDGTLPQLNLAGLDLTVDASHAGGAARITFGERLGLGLRIAVDRLNLDAYLPAGSVAVPPTAIALPSLLSRFDANFDAGVELLTWNGQPLRGVHVTGQLERDDLTFRSLSIGDVGGASGQVTGLIESLSKGGAKWQVAFDFGGPELGRVLRLAMPGKVAAAVAAREPLGPFSLGGGIRCDAGPLSLDIDLEAIGGRAHLEGEADAGPDFTLTVSHPSFGRLMQSLSPSYRPAGGELGPLKLDARLRRDAAGLAIDDLALAIGETHISGKLALALAGTRPKLTADLDLGTLAIDRFLPLHQTAELIPPPTLRPGIILAQAGTAPGNPTAPVPSDGAATEPWSSEAFDLGWLGAVDADLTLAGTSLGLGRWQLGDPRLGLTLDDGNLLVNHAAGRFFGGTLDASAGFAAFPVPTLHAKLGLKDAVLEQALAAVIGVTQIDGHVDLDASLAASGASPRALIASLAGVLTLHGGDGGIAGVDLQAVSDRLKRTPRSLDLQGLRRPGARTPFSTLSGSFRIAHGVAISTDLRLEAPVAEGRATVSFDLPGWRIESRAELRLKEPVNGPGLGVTLEGPIDAPRSVVDLNGLQGFLMPSGSGRD